MNKFYIGVDLEGVACAVGIPGEGMGNSANYAFAAREALREANANLDYDEVDPRCRIALGSGFHTRFPGIDGSFGGVLFIGYHAREGTGRAVLAHTYNSRVYQRYAVNGQEMGEMDIDAAYAGEHGVPVLFCASDAACVAQAKERFPWAETVVTKEGWGWNAAVSLHPREAQKRIYEGVRRAAFPDRLNSPCVSSAWTPRPRRRCMTVSEIPSPVPIRSPVRGGWTVSARL